MIKICFGDKYDDVSYRKTQYISTDGAKIVSTALHQFSYHLGASLKC